jgi:hypothetical protein
MTSTSIIDVGCGLPEPQETEEEIWNEIERIAPSDEQLIAYAHQCRERALNAYDVKPLQPRILTHDSITGVKPSNIVVPAPYWIKLPENEGR